MQSGIRGVKNKLREILKDKILKTNFETKK